MPDYAALRLRLSVHTACLSAQRRRSRHGPTLPSGQAVIVGGLALAAAWTGGAAMAQVAGLAQGAGLLQPAVLTSTAAPAAPDAGALAARKREAEQKRAALLTLVSQLSGAVKADQAAPNPADLIPVLNAIEQAADVQSRELSRVLRTLGISSSVLPGSDQDAAGLIKISAPATLVNDYGLDSTTAERIQQVATRVRAVQALSAAIKRVPIAAPLDNPVRSSPFGGRSDPFTGSHAFHAGQDFSGGYMSRIEATAPGIVSFTGQRNGYGNTVEVDHGGGFKTRYAHLAAISTRVGQAVHLGDKLGGMGSTGRSTGTHLHYEVWVNGVVQNPERFLRAGLMLTGGSEQRWAEAPRARRWTVASRNWRHHGRVHARFGA